jgi:RNA polymerase sigma-70 factor (ECF subfamily)
MLDRLRAERRQARREQEWTDGTETVELSAERKLIARRELEQADAALQALGDRTAAIFRRFRIDGASQRRIAEEQGISLSAVEKHLQKAYRALIELRRQLDAD